MATFSLNEMPWAQKSVFKRDCLDCPTTTPSCPPCPAGQLCSLIPQSCTQCAHMTCVPTGVATGGPKSSGPNVGAIAGGVVAGVAFIALLTFATWWFWIRPKRHQEYEEEWEEEDDGTAKSQFREQRDDRRSVHSVASTVLSRASNMIPIAFIPGVTNRDANTPPVPPIPAARNYSPSPLNSRQDMGAIFFSPGDLRNSAYSDASSFNNRDTIVSRQSITPSLARESVASDTYRDDAIANPMPAQQILRARPNMVSVKSGTSSVRSDSSPLSATMATPTESFLLPPTQRNTMASPNSPSVRSNASFGKPTQLNIVKKGQSTRFPIRSPSDASTARNQPNISSPLAAGDSDDDDDEPHARARQSLLHDRDSATTIQDTPELVEGPFSDSHHAGGLASVIEEATRRASRLPSHRGLGGRDQESPFSDDHASGED